MSIAIVWEVWQTTASFAWVGFSVLAFTLPGVFSSAVTGWAADKSSSARQLSMAGMIGIWAVTSALYVLWEVGTYNIWAVTILLVFRGAAVHVALISWRVFVPSLVPAESLQQAARLDVAASNAGRATGPLAVLPLLALFDMRSVWLAGLAGAALMVLALALAPPDRDRADIDLASGNDMRFWDAARKVAPVLLVGFAAAFTARSLWEIAAGLSATQYGTDASGFAGFMFALGSGSIVAVMLMGSIGDRLSYRTAAAFFTAAMAAGLAITGLSSVGAVGFAGFWVLGFAHVMQAMSSNAESQRSGGDSRGKALASYVIAVSVGISAGSAMLGWAANAVGIKAVHMSAAAAMGLLSALLFGWSLANPRRSAKGCSTC